MSFQERALLLNPNDDRSVCAMGEILTFSGAAEEAESWIHKAMSLNPYHPQRYYTHLARSLLHQRKFQQALTELAQIGRPRTDDLVYGLVAAVYSKDPRARDRFRSALEASEPQFSAQIFSATQPYRRTEDRSLILDTLQQVLA